jgi:uncharacterized membrane protein
MSMRYIAPLREHLRHLQARVPARKKVSPVTRPDVDAESFGLKLAEHVAGFLGTWRFIGGMAIFIVGWMLWNVLAPVQVRFDPWPFMGDNLAMSMMAALTGPILLIAAAAGAARDHRQSQRIEQLAWDGDKQNAEIQDTQAAQGGKLDAIGQDVQTLHEVLADMHTLLTDLNARIAPPITLGISGGTANANPLVAANQGTVTPPAPKRSHHKKKVAVAS